MENGGCQKLHNPRTHWQILTWVIASAISLHTLKFKAIAPVAGAGAFRQIGEVLISPATAGAYGMIAPPVTKMHRPKPNKLPLDFHHYSNAMALYCQTARKSKSTAQYHIDQKANDTVNYDPSTADTNMKVTITGCAVAAPALCWRRLVLSSIFDPPQNRHLSTDHQKLCHRWLSRRPLPLCQIRCTSVQLPFSLRQTHSGTSSSTSYSPIPSPITSSSSDSPLRTSITPSLFHSRLKTYLFHKSYSP